MKTFRTMHITWQILNIVIICLFKKTHFYFSVSFKDERVFFFSKANMQVRNFTVQEAFSDLHFSPREFRIVSYLFCLPQHWQYLNLYFQKFAFLFVCLQFQLEMHLLTMFSTGSHSNVQLFSLHSL